jgi:hypothetical protein
MRSWGADERRDDDQATPRGTAYGDFCTARERFFARLRADSEIRRLERDWALRCPEPGTGEPGR